MNYSILVPTRKRPSLLNGLMRSIYETVEDMNNVEIHIAYDLDDNMTISAIDYLKNTYKTIKMSFHGRERSNRFVDDYYNWMAINFSEGKYIISLNDDAKFVNYGWDNIALRKIENYLKDKPDGIFYGITQDKEVENNRNEQNYFSCFPLMTKAGVDSLGFLFDPEFYRDGADWDIVMAYRGINRILDLRDEIIIEHISTRSGRRQPDELDLDYNLHYPPSPQAGKNTKEYINFLIDYISNYGTDKYKGVNCLSMRKK